MIRTWRNAATRKIWEEERPNQFRGLDFDHATELLASLNAAKRSERSESAEEHQPS